MNVIVCLYSKYSERCKKFLDYVSTTSIDMKMLCIDNEKVRRVIENDKPHYSITTVPCILVFHINGAMEKFEGFQAFQYTKTVADGIEKSAKMFPPALEERNKDPVGNNDGSQQIQNVVVHQTPEEILSMDGHNGSDESIQPLGPPQGSDVPVEAVQFNKKKENILSMAMSMAKQREVEDEKLNPNPYMKTKMAQEEITKQNG